MTGREGTGGEVWEEEIGGGGGLRLGPVVTPPPLMLEEEDDFCSNNARFSRISDIVYTLDRYQFST